MLCYLQRENVSFEDSHSPTNANTHKTEIWEEGKFVFFFLQFDSEYINHLNSDVDSINIANLSFFPQDLASCKTSLGSNGKVQDVQGASGRSIDIYLIPQKVWPDLCNTGEPQT